MKRSKYRLKAGLTHPFSSPSQPGRYQTGLSGVMDCLGFTVKAVAKPGGEQPRGKQLPRHYKLSKRNCVHAVKQQPKHGGDPGSREVCGMTVDARFKMFAGISFFARAAKTKDGWCRDAGQAAPLQVLPRQLWKLPSPQMPRPSALATAGQHGQ